MKKKGVRSLMTGTVTAAAVQMRCSRNVKENIEKADGMVREAAAQERVSFCCQSCSNGSISARNGGTVITGMRNR